MVLLQTEWNNGAFVLLAAVTLIPITLVFFFLKMLLGLIPSVSSFLAKIKTEKKLFYYLFYFGLFVASTLITFAGAYLYYSATGKGVLE